MTSTYYNDGIFRKEIEGAILMDRSVFSLDFGQALIAADEHSSTWLLRNGDTLTMEWEQNGDFIHYKVTLTANKETPTR